MPEIQNENPTILNVSELPSRRSKKIVPRSGPDSTFDSVLYPKQAWLSSSSSEGEEADDDDDVAPIDEQDIFDLISPISDPEHPHTLGQLSVVRLPDIQILSSDSNHRLTTVKVDLTPTINHCSLATVIGLAVRYRLEQTLPPSWRVDVRMKDGSHAQDDQVNKQLGDKERVAAALENETLRGMLEKMLEGC
ncbi:hypothetical protein QBC38DRAFT_152028 [Podospora fimiseda]|uniref:MIP18 family-like domain-containing protein n=1 Tax=Podospora fimiseda TaxID=252190 RepID=A0AAN6YN10_9PEZI|nr:hypothetical protein QBC38DRAFT_152028 [Podospora fimiseda]